MAAPAAMRPVPACWTFWMDMDTADVVIIGAGVVGASVAYHLALAGCRNVLVVEREARPGLGSTGKATGGFRAQFGTEVNVRLSLLSREKLRRFHEEVGVDPGYRPCGYLFVAEGEARLVDLRAAMAVQRAAGLGEVEEVSAADVRRLNPALRTDRLVGGTFCPTDGFLRPLEMLRGYADAAARLGVRFAYGVGAAECLIGEADEPGVMKVTGVRVRDATIATPCVVNAAGAWAGLVARGVGIDIPVRPQRVQVAGTHPFPLLSEDMPMSVFAEDGFHLRVRDGRVLLPFPSDLASPDPFDTTVDQRGIDGILVRARDCVPCLAAAQIDLQHCWAGLYEASPDHHALVGPAAGVAGFYLVNGSSGHGVMHAPALGQLLAEVILTGRARALDIHALRPSRFAEGQPNVGPDLL